MSDVYNSVVATETKTDPKALKCSTNHGRIFWKEISWRFMSALTFSGLIVVTLYKFSKLGNLSRWEKRWFNVLVILCSALVSLSLSSLLGLLGNMIRWPLLARKRHRPLDVDLILGMANPTGSLKLIWQHTVKDRKWTKTTLAVAIFLVVNIAGRLSVAVFGLTFDLNEQPGIEYPVMVTDWSTGDWFDLAADAPKRHFGDNGAANPSLVRMNNYAAIALSAGGMDFNETDPVDYNVTNLGGQGLNRRVEGDTLTYSYFLKEYRGLEVNSSADKVLHSSSRCSSRTIDSDDVYEDGVYVGNPDDITAESEDSLYILRGIRAAYGGNLDEYLWVGELQYRNLSDTSACSTTYFFSQGGSHATLYECTTCLSDQNNNPGVGDNLFHGLPAINSTATANLLLVFGILERVWTYTSRYREESGLAIRIYSGKPRFAHFMNDLGAGYIRTPPFNNKSESELFAAHLAARLPLFAVMGAETRLPKVARDDGATERLFVNVVVEVRWSRAIGVLIALLVGQLAAIAIVMIVCRKVFVRDHDSCLSIARLLRSAMGKVDGGSVNTGLEIAEYLEAMEVEMMYGSRGEGDYRVVDLWNDIEKDFPDAVYR
ncbi:hypothetical protein TWF481_006349 [Arthrobotrys musiformis]|uniref:Uncharacterized protein n=1 Tax=Arthrobotrys musiformis TaxID=47236 RepID=A0AAV9WM46_9PEZI